jgi:elongation factor Ts
LDDAGGDFEEARALLRERGVAAAAKRSGRDTSQGVVESYIHAGGRIGVLVELNCETDFVARTDSFRDLARNVAMQIAAMNPLALDVDGVPDDVPADQREQHALLTQTFIKEPDKSIRDLVEGVIAQTGENVRIARFARYELGEAAPGE